MYIKQFISALLFLFSTMSLAGGTVFLANKTGEPIQIFNEQSSKGFERITGGPVLQNSELYVVVGPKASSYSFDIKPFSSNNFSYITFRVQCINADEEESSNHCEHYHLQQFSPRNPDVCWDIVKVGYDGDGPHDFRVQLSRPPCFNQHDSHL